MKKELFLFLFFNILIVFILIGAALFLKEPPVWPDETIYADIAQNLVKENRLGTDLWKGTIPGVENHALWYPPVFFYLLSFWFRIFGFSIINQRLLSFLIAIMVIIFYTLLSKELIKKNKNNLAIMVILSLFGLIVDVVFLKASRVSRPEIFILAFGFVAFWSFWQSEKEGKNSSFFSLFSGFFSSLTILTHTISLFIPLSILSFLFLKKKLKLFFSRQFYLFLISFLLPIGFWLMSIFPNFEILKTQMALAVHRKKLEWPWLWIALHDQPPIIKMIILIYLLLTFFFLISSLTKKNDAAIFLSLILFFAWIFSTYGRMFWYFVFPIPFIYLSFPLTFSQLNNWFLKRIYLITFIFLILLNLRLNIQFLSTLAGDNFSYQRFIDNILEIVPKNKTVFLSAIPDPYFGFKEKRGDQNKLYEFPVLKTDKRNYLEILNDSDYLIYTGSYETLVFGNFLQQYLEKNKEEIFPINKPYQYQALIIKLKPKSKRQSP